MKKLIVLLLALSVVGLAVVAQDAAAAPTLKWSGYLNTGALYEQVGSADATLIEKGQDSGHQGRFNVGGTYTNGDYGVTFRLRMQDDIDTTSNMFLNRGYGWMNFFGGKVKVLAGKLGDYTWSSANGYNNSFGNFDTKNGVQVQIMPIDGLNFGGFLPLATATNTAEYQFDLGAIGMAYTMKDMFDVQAGYQSNDNSKMASFWFGGDLYAVKNLAFALEGQLGNLGDDVNGSTYVYFDSTYTMDALGFGLTFAYESWAKAVDYVAPVLIPPTPAVTDTNSQIFVNPYVTYTMGNTEFGFGVDYGMKNSKSGLEFDPYVKVTVSGNSSLKIGAYLMSGDWAIGNAEGAWDPLSDNTTDIYADFVFNF